VRDATFAWRLKTLTSGIPFAVTIHPLRDGATTAS
jgi:hypothetical protein